MLPTTANYGEEPFGMCDHGQNKEDISRGEGAAAEQREMMGFAGDT